MLFIIVPFNQIKITSITTTLCVYYKDITIDLLQTSTTEYKDLLVNKEEYDSILNLVFKEDSVSVNKGDISTINKGRPQASKRDQYLFKFFINLELSILCYFKKL